MAAAYADQQQEEQMELNNNLEIEERKEENPLQGEAADAQQEEEVQQVNLYTFGGEVRTETNPLQGRYANIQQQEDEEEVQNNYLPTLGGFQIEKNLKTLFGGHLCHCKD